MLKYNVISRKNPQTNEVKYYGQLEAATPVKLATLTDVISRQSTVTVHDVKAVLSALEEHLITFLCNGSSVRLGDLGSFHLTMKSKGALTKEDFSSGNIKRVCVRFTPSSNMRYLLDKTNPNIQFLKQEEEEEESNI